MTHLIDDTTFVILGGDPVATAYTAGLLAGQRSVVLQPERPLPPVTTQYVVLLEAGEAPELQRCRHAALQAVREGLDFVAGRHPADRLPLWDSTTVYSDHINLLDGTNVLGQACVMREQLLRAAVDAAPGRSRRMLATHAVIHGDTLEYAFAPLAYPGIGADDDQNPIELVDEWAWTHDQLASVGVNHARNHVVPIALPNLLHRLIFAVTDEQLRDNGFAALRTLVEGFGAEMPRLALRRHQAILDTVRADDHDRFLDTIRPRMVVAGHDLKFIEGCFETFQAIADLKVDQWQSHEDHDVAVSQDLAGWADLVFAEWLLGAAEFYSRRIQPHQRLVVRCHRVDMVAKFGLKVNWDKVDKLIAIAPHTLHDFVDRFDIPREKVELIPNWFDVDSYQRSENPDRVLSVAMVGSLPKLKGLHRAYELINILRREDDRYRLRVYGKRPEDLDWLMRRDAERAYYEDCDRYLVEHNLEDYVSHEGWLDTTTGLQDVGFVVSLSDFEGMQVSVGEAYCASAAGIMLNWRGADQCYPEEFVFSSVEEIARFILEHRDPDKLHEAASRGREYVRARYDKSVVTQQMCALFSRL